MQFGVTLPNLGFENGPSDFLVLARAAEAAGWDGVFVWDTFGGPEYDAAFPDGDARRSPWDPWTLLTAVAASTDRIRLGTMVTPLSRRRPWNVAAQVATLDHLSGGRMTLPVSLGWVPDAAFRRAHEELSRPIRARRLDEALEIICSMWMGQRVTFDGEFFSLDGVPGVPSLQQPRVPIWVVGAWPRRKSIERVLRFDGLIPSVFVNDLGWLQPSPQQLDEIMQDVGPHTPGTFDVVVEGNTAGENGSASTTREYRDAGATWWLEGVWSLLAKDGNAFDAMLRRIGAGPPRP
jgi:hypothetical protein